MNGITPLDIQRHKFHTRFRGFDVNEVNNFLEFLSDEMEDLVLLNQQLKEDIKRKQREIEENTKREAILKETMITAHKTTKEMKANSEKEAKLIVSEAQFQADKIIRDTRERVSQLLGEIDDLKKQRMRFETSLRYEIEIHAKMLEAKNKKEEEMAHFDQKLKFMKKD